MEKGVKVHFIGIGGIGMSGIAKVLLEMGWSVSGSDLKENGIVRKLKAMGGKIYIGHSAVNLGDADLVVVSSAIPSDNPEVLEARRRGIPVYARSEMLGYLMREQLGITVAGTHGKTTTTSMVAMVLERCGLEPTVVIGGEVNDIGSNAKLGRGKYLVAEADESDGSFLDLEPTLAVVTSIDSDVNLSSPAFASFNFDYDATMKKIEKMFLDFMDKVPDHGRLILCSDNDRLRNMLGAIRHPYLLYGLQGKPHVTAKEICFNGFSSRCKVYYEGNCLGELALKVPGRHNVQNALAAVAVGVSIGLEPADILNALASFEGVQRRFQILGCYQGITVVDDYAHNPAKIKAALHSARIGASPGDRVVAVFQPHRFTRTKFLAHEFAGAFEDADVVLVCDIYSAGEVPIIGVRSEMLVDLIREHGKPAEVVYTPTEVEVFGWLNRYCKAGDIVVTLGAGDVGNWGARYLDYLGNPNLRKAAM